MEIAIYGKKERNSISLTNKLALFIQQKTPYSQARPELTHTHHLGFFLAFLPHVIQHIFQFGFLLVHFIQAVLGILFLSLELLQVTRLPIQIILQFLRKMPRFVTYI